MGKEVYYIVQTAPAYFLRWSSAGHFVQGIGRHEAHHFGAISEAWRELRALRGRLKADGASRFPRLLKVTVETKSIKHR